MRRILTAILALVYLAITSGIVVNTHYCRGKKSGVKLQAFVPAKCICGKNTESGKGCCKTELKVLKVSDAQHFSVATPHIEVPVSYVSTSLNLLQTPFQNTTNACVAGCHSPPLLSEPDLYLRNRVFRI